MKIYLFLLSILFPVVFWSQEPPQMSIKDSDPFEERVETIVEEDFYNEDGTFQRLANGKVIANGFHINRVLDGKFTEYNRKGVVTRKCSYRMGKLHGEEIVYDPYGGIITKHYDNGSQVGYEVKEQTSQTSISKTGPYFAGTRKESFVFTRTSSFPAGDEKGSMMLREDSVFFVPNQPVEIHWWMFTGTTDQVTDTLTHEVCVLLDKVQAEYSMENVLEIDNMLLRRHNFTSGKSDKSRAVFAYYKSGLLKEKIVGDYRLTYYPNGVLQDSILPELTNTPYYHYRNDTLGRPLFRSKFEYPDEAQSKKLIFDYLNNNQVFYTITSVNSIPEKVMSSDDFIQKQIRNGEFVDYYGTHYMTQVNGIIDTSYSKLVFSFRYKTPLKEGTYYYLPSRVIKRVTVLQVNKHDIFTYEISLDNSLPNRDTIHMKKIMQNGTYYYLSPSTMNSSQAKKLMVAEGKIYTIDWNASQLMRSEMRYMDKPEEFAAQVSKDTLLSFKTQLFNENEFRKALKLKSISKMPKAEFNQMLEEISVIRTKERDALSKINSEDREKVSIESRAICLVFYTHGYNPFFSDEDFSKLMTSYGWTKEEERAIKSVLRQ